jgi:hypothetical protein
MKTKVYKITTYEVGTEKFYTYTLLEVPNDKIKTDNNGEITEIVGEYFSLKPNRLHYFSFEPKGIYEYKEKFLPYFADVTEDINPTYKVEAKTYKNCQLMTEKHGGYLQFFHEGSGEVLRIAINSHYFTPIKTK